MARRAAIHRLSSFARPLAAAIAAWACLGWGMAASASASEEASHHCACDTHCKGASCCCPSDSEPEAPVEIRRPVEPVADAATSPSPCVRSTPCGDPEVPATGSTRPVTRSAILPGPSPAPAVADTRLRANSDAPALPPRVASRLDDPPEA